MTDDGAIDGLSLVGAFFEYRTLAIRDRLNVPSTLVDAHPPEAKIDVIWIDNLIIGLIGFADQHVSIQERANGYRQAPAGVGYMHAIGLDVWLSAIPSNTWDHAA